MSLLDEVGPCKAVERDEEARLGHIREVKEREYFQNVRYELFTKQHFSLTRISTRIPMGIFASTSSLPQPLLRLQLLLHFGVQGQLFIFLPFNGRCRSRLRQHPLYILEILPPVRHLILLSHPVHRIPRPRDHVHRPTTRLSALNQSVPLPTIPRKKRVAVKKGWKGRVEGSPPPSEKLVNLDDSVLQQQ